MARLNKLRVAFISLVKRPANKLDIVYKCADTKFTDDKELKIEKSTSEGIVYGTVYEPNVKDVDGDWADAETIRKAAHDFLLRGQNANIDTNHNEVRSGASVVESYLDEGGSWKVAIQMDPKSDVFLKVQKGELKGLSMGAYCEKTDEEPVGDAGIGAIFAKLEKSIGEMSAKIENIENTVRVIPKTRQLSIDGDVATIGKGSDVAAFQEFRFQDLE